MTTPQTYDAIIIGSSRSAIYLSMSLAQAGRRTALIERDLVGGTCLNVGCVLIRIPTGKNILSAHVLVEQYPESEPILQRIQSILKDEYKVYFSTIQVESEICPEIEQAEEIDFLRQPAMPGMDSESHQMPGTDGETHQMHH